MGISAGADIATLGLVVDNTGAVLALKTFATEAKTAGVAGEQAAAKITEATKQQTTAVAAGAERMRAARAAYVQAYDDQAAASQRATDAVKRAVEAQRKKDLQEAQSFALAEREAANIRRMTLLQIEAIAINEKMASSLNTIGTNGKSTEQLFNRLRPGLASLTTQMTNTTSAVGVLGSSLASFGIGNALTVGVLAGIAAVTFAYEKLTESSRKAKEEQQKLTKALEEWAQAQRLGATGLLEKQLAAEQAKLAAFEQSLQQARDLADQAVGVSGAIGETPEQKKAREEYIDAIRRGQAEVKKLQDELLSQTASTNAANIAQRLQFNAADAAARAEGLAALKRDQSLLQQYLTLPETPENSARIAEIEQQAKTLSDALYPKATSEQKAAARDAARAYLNEMQAAAAEAKRMQADAAGFTAAIDKQTLEMRKSNQREYVANVKESLKDAAAAAVRFSQDQLAEDAKNLLAGINARVEAQQAYNRALRQGVNEATQAAEGLLRVFTNINRSLIDAVGSIGRMVEAMARGNAAGFFKDAAGVARNVGFGGALKGEAGGAAQLTAAASGVALIASAVSTVVSLADAVDLFGTKAREQAAAIRAELERQTAAYAANVAAQRRYVDGLSDAEHAIQDVRAQFAALRVQLLAMQKITVSGPGHTTVENQAPALAALDRLEAERIALLAQEAAALAAANAENERRATDDLRVRQLRARGLTAEAYALAFTLQQQHELTDAIHQYGEGAYTAALRLTQQLEEQKRATDAAAAAAKALADHVAELAAAFEQNKRANESLIGRGLAATGDTRGAEDARRLASNRQELYDAVLAGMSPLQIAFLQFVQFAEASQIQMQRAIEDGTKAIQAAEKAQIQVIDDLIDAVKAEAQAQLDKLDAQIAAEQKAAAAVAKAYDAQIDAVRAATKAQTDAIDAQISAAQDSLRVQQAQLQAMEQQVAESKRVVEALTTFSNSLKLGEFSTLSPGEKLAEARAQFERLAAAAQGGDATAAAGLPDAGNALLTASRAFNASNSGFVADFNRVQSVVNAVTAQFGAQLPVAERQLEAMRAQVSGTQAMIEQLGRQKDAIQKAGDTQIQILQKAKDQAAEDARLVIEGLNAQKDAINASTQATLDKLDATKTEIHDAAQRQIDQLIANENAAHLDRVKGHEYWATYLDILKHGFPTPPRTPNIPDLTGTGTARRTPTFEQQEQTTAAVVVVADRVATLVERVDKLLGLTVGASSDEVDAVHGVTIAVDRLTQATRDAALLARVRR